MNNVSCSYFFNQIELTPLKEKANRCCTEIKTWSAAHPAFIELTASLALNLVVITFVAAPLNPSAITLALMGYLVGAVVQGGFALYKKYKHSEEDATQPGQHIARVNTAVILGRAWPNIAIHETGHALSALSCFKKADPLISVSPMRGGNTNYAISYGLTPFGKLLGMQNARLLTSAAGIMASTVFAMLEFGLAEQIKDQHPTISKSLNYHGISLILTDVIYGLTTFIASRADLTHDFMYLWQAGNIHPLIPITLMIAIPLIEVLLIKLYDHYQKAKPIDALAANTFEMS